MPKVALAIGVATATVNPPIGTPLGGYPVDFDRTSSGVHDDLRVLALSCRDTERGDHIVVVAFDGVAVPSSMGSALSTGTGPLVVPVASHTHSAPSLEVWDQGVMGDFSETYQNELIATCSNVVAEAIEYEQPGELLTGSASLDEPVGSNRRNPGGPADSIVRVLEARRQDGTVLAILVINGCHATVLGAENTKASSDIVEGIRVRVREVLPATPVAFLPGGAGDQSTRHTRRASTFDEAIRLGRVIGDAVIAARRSLFPADSSIVRQSTFVLPRRTVPDVTAADQSVRYWLDELARRTKEGDLEASRREAEVELIGARHDARRARQGDRADHLRIVITKWKLGPRTVCFWPVEPGVDLATHLEEEGGAWLCGYASDYFGYLLSPEDCACGGYEVAASPFRCEAADTFLERTHELHPP